MSDPNPAAIWRQKFAVSIRDRETPRSWHELCRIQGWSPIGASESDRQHQAIGAELTIVSAELNAGATLGQALRNLATRTAVEDIKPLATTLLQSEQVGPALRSISDTLRLRA